MSLNSTAPRSGPFQTLHMRKKQLPDFKALCTAGGRPFRGTGPNPNWSGG